jgi:hypothetical protein
MIDEFVTPSVPALSNDWIAIRTQHLIDELSAPSPRRTRRVLFASAGGGSLALAALLVGLLGPWATPAFAGWSAQPTSPTSDQLSTAETACSTIASNLAAMSNGTDSASLQPVSLSDVRGPYTLIVYGTQNPALCVSGTDLTSLHENGDSISTRSVTVTGGSGRVSMGGFSDSHWLSSSKPSPDGAVVNLTYTDSQNGASFTVAEGSVGSEVSGATLKLSDGTSVVATVNNGLFAAWWPGLATVSSIQATASAN